MSIPRPKTIPNAPGVYMFRKGTAPIYIGKAVNLKKRLSSYFKKGAAEKVRLLRNESTRLTWKETESEVEALIYEAELIKQYKPKFNVLMRDDKNYTYVGITKDKFPRIFITHQPSKNKNEGVKIKNYIGPFTSGSAVRETLRMLRRVFPYCTCKEAHKRPCLNAEIGRCFGFCCTPNYELRITDDEKRNEYAENIRDIAAVLGGKRTKLLGELKRGMQEASNRQEYERAGRLRDNISGIKNIFTHRVLTANSRLHVEAFQWEKIERSVRQLVRRDDKIHRIEGYDISNISGTDATGSMVVFIDGRPSKSEYRKFKIRTVAGANDVAMHQEVIRRRLAHAEWKYPELILIDGGKPQLSAALAALKSNIRKTKFGIPSVAALAKREEELYVPERIVPIPLKAMPPPIMHFFQRVRDESHRFAKTYHHKLREIAYRREYR